MRNQNVKNTAFRTWKSGKKWLYASSVLVALLAGGTALASTQAAAETTNLLTAQSSAVIQNSTAVVTSSAVISASGLSSYSTSPASLANSSDSNQTSTSVTTSSLKVQNVNLNTGDTWNPANAFVSGTDTNGNSISFSAVEVSGTVDTATPGVYTLTYTYSSISETVYVVVSDPSVQVKTTDAFLYTTQRYNQKLSVLHVEDSLGNVISPSDVSYKVLGQALGLDNTVIYTLEFYYVDSKGKTGISLGTFYNIPDYTGFKPIGTAKVNFLDISNNNAIIETVILSDVNANPNLVPLPEGYIATNSLMSSQKDGNSITYSIYVQPSSGDNGASYGSIANPETESFAGLGNFESALSLSSESIIEDQSDASSMVYASSSAALTSSLSKSSLVSAGSHVASYLGIVDSVDNNAVPISSAASAFPYSNIVRVVVTESDGSVSVGTGILIAPGIVLTAGHILAGDWIGSTKPANNATSVTIFLPDTSGLANNLPQSWTGSSYDTNSKAYTASSWVANPNYLSSNNDDTGLI
ncbi:MAG: bacterial Ig-like domain-containing protein [Streptococcaceae bacterium]|jgi:hypothetical protein|nr:bacterial Ig-like domain-containing protein [Streptococcaceae bacterium]